MRSLAAALALLLLSASVFAQSTAPDVTHQRSRAVRPGSAGRTTINNDSSCDIGVFPAATLLLPYFAVDVTDQRTENTIFSITNISPLPQIARVTIWSDWAFPVLTFNIFLTGYDVQPVNLFDVIARGVIPGTSTASPNARSSRGEATNPTGGTQPAANLGNPNFLPDVATQCAAGAMPSTLPANIQADVIGVLTMGTATGGAITCPLPNGAQAHLGSNHGRSRAAGYVTIDVVATCSPTGPASLDYFTKELLFDNVLTGEYEHIQPYASQISTTAGTFAGGSPMVHIRAVPEGGGAGSIPTGVTPLPFTFYDRLTRGAADRRIDRRQPLPSAFAVRSKISSTADTRYEIWREALIGASASCETFEARYYMPFVDAVRFDERENAAVFGSAILIDPPPPTPGLPPVSVIQNSFTISAPALITTDTGGWIYFNLANGGGDGSVYSSARPGYGEGTAGRFVSQNWVTVTTFEEGRFGSQTLATALGNGCSPVLPWGMSATDSATTDKRLAPSGGVVVCPPGTKPTNGDATACRGRNVNP